VTVVVFRSPSSSPVRIVTTRSKPSHWLTPSQACRESEDDRAIVLIAVLGDRGYDAEAIRQGVRARHIVPMLAKRKTDHGSGLGRWRWVVERTFAWLNQFRRLRVRYEKRADIHEALLALACALLCWNALERHGT
jgi:transposase